MDDDPDIGRAGPEPDDGGPDWAESGGGHGPGPGGARWVVASTGHLVCVEPARP